MRAGLRGDPLPATLSGVSPRPGRITRWLTFLAAAWLPTRPTTLKGR